MAEQKREMKKKKDVLRKSVVTRFIFTYLFLTAALIGLFIVITYVFLDRVEFERLRTYAADVAQRTATLVDVPLHESIQAPEDQDSVAYSVIQDVLVEARVLNPTVESIYTMRPEKSSTNWQFVVDSTSVEDVNGDGIVSVDELPAEVGETYDVSCCPELPKALTGPTADTEFTSDKWGTWISGYAPLTDSDGRVVGIVGVDVSLDTYLTERAQLVQYIEILTFFCLLLSALFGYWGSVIFRRENQRIKAALEIRATELSDEVQKRTRALESFMATIVHELRAPLTALNWQIEALRDAKNLSSKHVHEEVLVMGEAVTVMRGIVNMILDAVRLDLKKFTLNIGVCKLPEVITTEMRFQEKQAKQKGVELKTEVSPKLPAIEADSDRIAQVVRNLLSNAVKYTDVGSVTVRSSLVSTNRVRFEVEDTGVGISEENQEQLFRAFYRVSEASVHEGSGLGLSIAKGIIEAHGGTIGCTSKPGKGSTFWFEIPVSQPKTDKKV